MKPDSSVFSRAGEAHWVKQVSETWRSSIAIDIEVPPCVFHVPKSLAAVKPEAYVPHLIGLGPNNHFRAELYAMEGYKLAAVKRFLNQQYPTFDLLLLVDRLKQLERKIRGCYNNYLDFDGDTLAWMMAIDGLFFLDFCGHRSESDMGCAANFAGISRKLTEQAILRDVMMLENQIPLLLLKEILKTLQSPPSADDDTVIIQPLGASRYDTDLRDLLLRFSKKISPLKFAMDPKFCPSKPLNLLDFLHQLIVNKEGDPLIETLGISKMALFMRTADDRILEDVKVIGATIPDILPAGQPSTNIIKFIISLPWGRFFSLLGLKKGNSGGRDLPSNAVPHSGDGEVASIGDTTTQLTVPLVSQLHSIGVKLSVASDITGIKFDDKEITLYLPEITLNVNSETMLRNLVAYEASSAMSASTSACLELAGYVDVMNAIIDSKDDVALLRKNKIIEGRLSDGEIATIFNGMTKSIGKSDQESEPDKTVEKLTKYYNNNEEVKRSKLREKRKQVCLDVLKFVASLLVVLLLSVQAFCQVYGCSRFFAGKSTANSMLADI